VSLRSSFHSASLSATITNPLTVLTGGLTYTHSRPESKLSVTASMPTEEPKLALMRASLRTRSCECASMAQEGLALPSVPAQKSWDASAKRRRVTSVRQEQYSLLHAVKSWMEYTIEHTVNARFQLAFSICRTML
jgi:hypothetical protein